MDKKHQQLGMPHSTAMGRLKKMLMFDMAKKLGMDRCFRCGNKIESAKEMSLDHSEDWIDVSLELFWDVNKIVFSHHSCNSSAHRVVNRVHLSKRAKKISEGPSNARYMRSVYTRERRHLKYITTGH